MKGLILAAGLGTRLRPLTYTRPKPVLRVANKPMIVYAIENLRDADITEIGLVVSEMTRSGVEEAVKDVPGVKLEFVLQEKQLGLAHAVKQAETFLAGEDFCMYLGDNLFEKGVRAYVEAFKSGACDAVIGLVKVADPREFGVAVLDETGKIVRLVEKPKEPPSDLAVAGVYCFNNKILRVIDDLKPSARGEYEITDAIVGLMEHGVVRGLEVQGWWKDTGRAFDLLDANRLILEGIESGMLGTNEDSRLVGRVRVEPGAIVRNSTVIGPAIIGPGAVLDNVYIGPFTSIGANAKLSSVEVEFSVIEEEAVLENVPVRFQECLIGQRAKVSSSDRVPRVHRLVLSDASTLELG
jgi:glucose-1-phosphate thymidylyltransferase